MTDGETLPGHLWTSTNVWAGGRRRVRYMCSGCGRIRTAAGIKHLSKKCRPVVPRGPRA